jgi:TATA-box binding protein (TBP) (component of TFIID and TFIIIB)
MQSNSKISTITISCCFPNCHFNLINIGRYLEIDDDIIGIKYKYGSMNIIKGGYITTVYKKAKIKDLKKINSKLFYNQISLIVKTDANALNVKVFGNGSLHITGCKLESDASYVVKLLYEKFNQIRNKTVIKEIFKDKNNVYIDQDNLIYTYEKGTIIGYKKDDDTYVVNKKEYTIDKRTLMWISRDTGAKRTKQLLNFDGIQFGTMSLVLFKNKSKFYNKNMNILLDWSDNLVYHNNEIIIGKLDYTFDKNLVLDTSAPPKKKINYSCNPFMDPLYVLHLDLPNFETHIDVNINCMNIYFRLPFKLNRMRLYENFLKYDFLCKYKPESYSGVKVTMKIPLDEPNVKKITGYCNCDKFCTCKNITFLIFQSGNVIATGFKSFTQSKIVTRVFLNKIQQIQDDIKIN